MVLFMMITVPVFATGIGATNGAADPATCDTGTLGSDTGPVDLRANFTPETIDLRWYNNNTLLNVTSTNSNDCTYDTPINLPANPTKPGYKFKGWKVRPEMDFSSLYNGTAGPRSYGKGRSGNNPYCLYSGPEFSNWRVGCIDGDFDDLQINEWKAQFDWGMLYGQSLCSITEATNSGDTGIPNQQTSGTYCWCKATGYKQNNTNIMYGPSNNLPWVFVENTPSCGSRCALLCATHIRAHTDVRRTTLGVTIY